MIDDDEKAKVIQKANEWHDVWAMQREDFEGSQNFPDLVTSDMSLADEAAQWASEILPGADASYLCRHRACLT
eukprot:6829867-Alexandrium_andersonii.AAC.1